MFKRDMPASLTGDTLRVGEQTIPLEQIRQMELKKNLFSTRLLVHRQAGPPLVLRGLPAQQASQLIADHQAWRSSQTIAQALTAIQCDPASLSRELEAVLASPSPQAVPEAIDILLETALQRQASDIHLLPGRAGTRVQLRLHGLLETVALLPSRSHHNLMVRLKVLAGLAVYRQDIPQEGRYERRPGVELRVSLMPTVEGEKAALRLFNQQDLRRLDALGFSVGQQQALKDLLQGPPGLLIVSGPCGSGKTTTLYALLRHLQQQDPHAHIVTLEDPVEQKLAGLTQIEVAEHRELSFAKGLARILRQDPNIIMVGEIRDAETAGMAVQAGLTGHLVLSTVHAGNNLEVLLRLLDMGVEPYKLASALKGLLNQRLVRQPCPDCPAGQTNQACRQCFGSGVGGREAISELLPLDEVLRQAILERRSTGEIKQILSQRPLSLWEDGLARVQQGKIALSELERVYP